MSGTDLLAKNDTEPRTEARPQKVHIVVNLRAGTALDLPPAEIERTIKEPFVRAGHTVAIDCVMPEDVEAAIARAVTGDIDILVVGGGDGTIRTAARFVLNTSIALGILPLGTMNRMAKDLEIPLTLAEAAAFLAVAEAHPIDVATVNGSIFLCNSVMGTTLRYSIARARMRGRPAYERLPRYFAIIRDILASRRKLSILIDDGSERLRVRALSLAVTNNGYDESRNWLRRGHLSNGTLTLYVSKHRTGFGLAVALARALLGQWNGDPEMVKLTGSAFTIHSEKRTKRLANDGELAKFETPLRYAIIPRSLNVLMRKPAS